MQFPLHMLASNYKWGEGRDEKKRGIGTLHVCLRVPTCVLCASIRVSYCYAKHVQTRAHTHIHTKQHRARCKHTAAERRHRDRGKTAYTRRQRRRTEVNNESTNERETESTANHESFGGRSGERDGGYGEKKGKEWVIRKR